MSALDYDENDPELEEILENVHTKPTEDPIAIFDQYNPRYSAGDLEGYARGYQYAFPSSRGLSRRGVMPSLDDPSRIRLRKSQEAIWNDGNAPARADLADPRHPHESASPLVFGVLDQVLTPTHKSYRSHVPRLFPSLFASPQHYIQTDQFDDGSYGSHRILPDYSTDESADYDDASFYQSEHYPPPAERYGARPPVASMSQSMGPSYRRPQPQRMNGVPPGGSSLFMDDNPMFHRSNPAKPGAPGPEMSRPPGHGPPSGGPIYNDEEEAYYDELEYEEEYRSHEYRGGYDPRASNPRYGGAPYNSAPTRRHNAAPPPADAFRQSHVARPHQRSQKAPPPQGQVYSRQPDYHPHPHHDPYAPSGQQYPPGPQYDSANRQYPSQPPRYQGPPSHDNYGHDSYGGPGDSYDSRYGGYSEPEQDGEYEQHMHYNPNVARIPHQRSQYTRHSPVKVFSRQEEFVGAYPNPNRNLPGNRRPNPLPYSSELPDYLNSHDDAPPMFTRSQPPAYPHHHHRADYPQERPSMVPRYQPPPMERGGPRGPQMQPMTSSMPPQPLAAPPAPQVVFHHNNGQVVEQHRPPPPPNIANLPPNMVPPPNFLSAAAEAARVQIQTQKGSVFNPKPRTPSPIPDKMQIALKAKLQLSPATKAQFKDFYREYKNKEREGFDAAKLFAAQHFQLLPEKVHWKIYLEVADLAKRENKLIEAAKYYEKVNMIQPFAAKGWLEFAKMMEESGDLDECTRILTDGLYFCPQNESLLVKGIKHAERIGNINLCRVLLARLKNVSMDRSWRTVMEGGLLEARQGNIDVARQIFKYLFQHVPLYGPVYIEAIQMEVKRCEYERALAIVTLGIEQCPTYGPLWLLAIQVEEALGRDFEQRLNDSLPYLSKELVWKMYYEAAQFYESKRDEAKCWDAYVKAVLTCPTHVLLWRIWSGGARTAIHFGKVEMANQLLMRAYSVVPAKMKPSVLIDSARFEEYLGEVKDARRILRKAKRENPNDWKAFLESVLLEMRAGDLEAALNQVKEALEVHSSTGRLWAMFINLSHLVAMAKSHAAPYDPQLQTAVFTEALANVPKSGEVWCEGARLAMHARLFPQARKFLEFAVQFTPQYGDSFIELLRLEFLERIAVNNDISDLDSFTEKVFTEVERVCINSEPSYGVSWSFCRESTTDNPRQTLRHAREKFKRLVEARFKKFGPRPMAERPSVKSTSSADDVNSESAAKPLDKDTQISYFEIPAKNQDDFVLIDLDILASFVGRGEDYFGRTDKEVLFRSIFI